MESAHFHNDLALLDWQIELGATEAIADAPINRYDVPASVEKPKTAAVAPGPVPMAAPQKTDLVAEATRAAQSAQNLDDLRAAMAAFEHCELKRGARNMVFCEGTPGARVMLIGDAPDREEDRAGKLYVGKSGQLLDKMLGAINLGRGDAETPVAVASVLPWRAPNRDPKPQEIEMMKPFLLRQIELAGPEVLVLMGNWACQTLLGKRGINRLRGTWTEVAGRPALPMLAPAHLMRSPEFKRDAWADLLSLQAHLQKGQTQT